MLRSVSILICTRDRPEMLETCLRSVLEGTVAAAEVIVVDQSQDEATRLSVCRYQGGKVPVRYLRGKGVGVSRAKNQGIADCTSDIIAFTDDDCLVDPGWIAALIEPLLAGRASASVGRTVSGPAEGDGEETFSVYAPDSAMVFGPRTHPWRVGGGGNFAILRQVLGMTGPFDERFGPGAPLKSAEDMDLVHRLLRGGRRIVYVPEAVVRHRSWRDRDGSRRLSRSYGIGAGGYFTKYLLAGDLLSGWRFFQRFGVRSLHLIAGALRADRRRMAEQGQYLIGLFEGAARFVAQGRETAPALPNLERRQA
jgi:Glycosyltransferases, probably involved in cell wall biogenesis